MTEIIQMLMVIAFIIVSFIICTILYNILLIKIIKIEKRISTQNHNPKRGAR